MFLAKQYAKALHALSREHPRKGVGLARGLYTALERRGHTRLLPKIVSEVEKLHLRETRRRAQTPEGERTRTLLQLYRHLTRTI